MINIVGPTGTSEHSAALMVRNAMEAVWPGISTSPAEQDDVRIAVSVKISGYKVQDIDIVVAGRLRQRVVRPVRVIRDHNGNRLNSQPLQVDSFVIAVEVKDQDERGVTVNDDQVQVRYSQSGRVVWKSATDQNIAQLHSLKAYFSDQHANVFVRRCMVFQNLRDVSAPSAVASGFNVHQFFSAVASPSPVPVRQGRGVLSAGSPEDVARVLASPLFRQMLPTRLDRERMDRLTAQSPKVDDLIGSLGSGLVFLRGYGGTGKTVLLLQAAWKLFKAEGKRTLILTYNLALAADIRRLMALMAIPSSSEDGGIEVGTVMSFLYRWFAQLSLLDGEEGDFSRYPALCSSAIEMIESGTATKEDLEGIIASEPDRFDFDQILVDEGQDWPQGETTLLKLLYNPNMLCVADGIDQLTRGQRADWRTGTRRDERKTLSLSTCLRLKRNLSLFVARLARTVGAGWEAKVNPVAGGGRLIVLCRPYETAKDLHEQLVLDLRKDGNAPVDMLFCVPPQCVEYDGQGARSNISSVLARWGQASWDGVNAGMRLDFPRSSEDVRIVQYASCRGLEGWTVVLDAFDDFLEGIEDRKRTNGLSGDDAQGLVDLDTLAMREAWRWGMIALTRPIDSLVIQLKNPKSRYAECILGVAQEFGDFCEIVA